MITPDAFLNLCAKTADEIKEAVAPLIGTDFGAEEIAMGADNTPTERLDKVAEDIVIRNFRAVQACRYLLSEEAGLVDLGGDKGIVYLDPVDGSFNAARGLPFYAVSFGLSDGKRLAAGYVRDLSSGESFSAVRGGGAFLNGRALQPSVMSDIRRASISYYANRPHPKMLQDVGLFVRRTRQFGASALELCYVAAGRLEAFLDLRGNLRITDAAGGILICEEAGVLVTLPSGEPADFPDDVKQGRPLLAAPPALHAQIVEALKEGGGK
ncbi:MAG TPA: bifunctional fructose-bisphosphatase/inositol-phosphate phosphatase [Methanocorpusculum sp.]|nr:bifunctional fructose-bisphosphatase/inositol-phosphate phosphatase [Methanocorpusculum sp.]